MNRLEWAMAFNSAMDRLARYCTRERVIPGICLCMGDDDKIDDALWVVEPLTLEQARVIMLKTITDEQWKTDIKELLAQHERGEL